MSFKSIHKYIFPFTVLLFTTFIANESFAQKSGSRKSKKQQKKEAMADRLFIEGEKHMMLEDFEKAYFYFGKAHELNPDAGAINFKLAEILSRANQNEDALEYGQKAIAADPDNKYYHLLVAEVYTKQNQPDKAAEILKSLIENSDKNQQYILELASIYLGTQQYDKALKALDEAEEYYGVLEQLSVQKQRIYLSKNDLESAVKEGEKLIEANPGNSRFVLALVEMLFNNNRTDQALEVVTKSLEDYPNQGDLNLASYTLLKKKGEIKAAHAQLYKGFSNPDLEGSVKAQTYADIIQQDLKTPEREALLDSLGQLMVSRNPNEAEVYAILGDRALFDQNNDQALSHYQKSISLNQNDPKVLQSIISLMFELGKDFGEIEKYTTIGVEVFEDKPEFWFFHGTTKLALNKHKEAEQSLLKSQELNKGLNSQLDLMIMGQLGDTYHALDKNEKAYAAYDSILKQTPNDEHVLNNYAYFLSLEKKDLPKAYNMSNKLVKQFPDNATYLDTHAWVLFQMENYEQAKIFMERALDNEVEPSGVMLEHYGDILYHLGEKNEALKYWKKALSLNDISEVLNKKIKDIKYYE
ncbi:tetratricopeptide repeat protein [Echinicola marina]|uniref:tetratricopeptide repeat protein n=1 Tax=Echinicola marina TaxID=2859768 RepID=UPI001CF6A904|nr:tetratricopeptide repeat protein [Echinicola marina]UCS93196.1 tetratricopeptide repeat protein [Echinicola marina]